MRANGMVYFECNGERINESCEFYYILYIQM